jgi:large subunit ribosomal protein L29
MKTQDKQTIRESSVSELKVRLQETQDKLFKLRFANSLSPIKNPLQIKHLRILRAQLLTWIRQKETQS